MNAQGHRIPQQDIPNEDTDYDTILSEIRFGSATSLLLDRLIDQESGGTPRDSQAAPRPRDRLLYLRNLIHSESNRSNADETIRALETLNREIEDHHLDQARDRTNFEQARAAVDRQIQQLRSDQTPESRRSWLEQTTNRPPSTLSPSSLEPRPPSNRSVRRRPFRPDLRDSIPTPSLMPQSSPSGRQRLKRRKLESDDNREGTRGFNYGHQGQVVPGALKMEIASCDGGIYDPDGDSSFPENVLRNDQSVYCTKSDRCNLVLRHRGEAPFCLKKIVIKAPRNGFDSP